MLFGSFVNRKDLVKKTFVVRVAYPKDVKNAVTATSIYNSITGGTNYIECDVKEQNDNN